MDYIALALVVWFLTMSFYTKRFSKALEIGDFEQVPCFHCGKYFVLHKNNLRVPNLCSSCK